MCKGGGASAGKWDGGGQILKHSEFGLTLKHKLKWCLCPEYWFINLAITLKSGSCMNRVREYDQALTRSHKSELSAIQYGRDIGFPISPSKGRTNVYILILLSRDPKNNANTPRNQGNLNTASIVTAPNHLQPLLPRVLFLVASQESKHLWQGRSAEVETI